MKTITPFILILSVTAICFAQSKSYTQLKDGSGFLNQKDQHIEKPQKMPQQDTSYQSTQSITGSIAGTSVVQLSDLQNSQFQADSLLAEMQTVSQEIDFITAGLQDIHQRLRSLQEQLKIAQQQNNGYMIMKQPESEITVLNSRIKTLQNTLSEKMKKMGKLQMRLNELYAQGKMKDSQQQADRYDIPLGTGKPDTQENALKTLSLPSE
jgi:predicted RNase H-like nuclease (RuvC/YqgF family)